MKGLLIAELLLKYRVSTSVSTLLAYARHRQVGEKWKGEISGATLLRLPYAGLVRCSGSSGMISILLNRTISSYTPERDEEGSVRKDTRSHISF